MGVRFFDKENMTTRDDYSSTTRTTNCNCNTCNPVQQTPTTTTTSSSTQTCSSGCSTNDNVNNLNYQKSGILREIIGNCKEMRIEENIHNLRIVGNNNRIRITFNVGDITIIGNNTRLKIKNNHGLIKYTGNDGRICLGKDSSEQLVDYSGCNGVLKVQNSKKSKEGNNSEEGGLGNTYFNEKFNKNKKTNIKYASYSGSPTESEVFKCHMDYHNKYQRKKSMPNINTENLPRNTQPQPKSIVHNFGNIVIANSSNVCITPYSYTY